MKMTSLSRCRTDLKRIVVVLFLGCTSVGYVAFANDPINEEPQTVATQDTLETESQLSEGDETQSDEDLFEELLDFQRLLEENDEADTEYSDEERCVDTRRIRHYDVLSARFVAFEMRQADEIYLVQFEQKCPGLNKNGTLTFELRSGQSGRLCVNDSIQPKDGDLSTQTEMRGGTCRIPSIEKITEVQLVQLERGLASNRVE